MARLALYDFKLGLKELVENQQKQKLLASTAAGMLYLPKLAKKRAEIEALPAAIVDAGRPLAEQLRAEDDLHDGFGLAIWYLSEGYRLVPGLASDLREIFDKVRAKVIGSRSEVTRSYPEEASSALDRARELPALEADLKKIPIAGGATLYDWVVAYNEHGANLHELLVERGAQTAQSASAPDRTQAMLLRTETQGLLSRFRDVLADEAADSTTLPPNLDGLIFGYFDELLRIREEREARAAAGEKDAKEPAVAAAGGAEEGPKS